jgi:hypothetical protein
MPNTRICLANLLLWQQSPLNQMTMEHSHQEIPEMLQANMKPPIIAMDGSVKLHRAQETFAWVMADQDGTLWLRCCEPVSRTPINSFCALLSVLVYLNLMADYFKASIPTTDSESNIKRINLNRHRRRHEFPNKTLSPSWDLHQAIHRELIKLPNI